MKKLAPIIGLLVLAFLVMQLGYMSSASRSERQCERLVAFSNNSHLVDKVKRQVRLAISSENNLKIMAGAGGSIYSHELPTAFSKLDLNIDWNSIGINGSERYIAFGGDWWDMSGTFNLSRITRVSLGEGPRQYVMMHVGSGVGDISSTNDAHGVAYKGKGALVYCEQW